MRSMMMYLDFVVFFRAAARARESTAMFTEWQCIIEGTEVRLKSIAVRHRCQDFSNGSGIKSILCPPVKLSRIQANSTPFTLDFPPGTRVWQARQQGV